MLDTIRPARERPARHGTEAKGVGPEHSQDGPNSEVDVQEVVRWLANQRAISPSLVEPTAWLLVDEAQRGRLALAGAHAPIIMQERFSLWLIGQLGGRPLLHIFVDEAVAREKARAVGAERDLPVLIIDRGGDIAERIDPTSHRPPVTSVHETPSTGESPPKPVLKVDRHGDQWAVFVDGRVVATAPTRERARQRARVLRSDPDFIDDLPAVQG